MVFRCGVLTRSPELVAAEVRRQGISASSARAVGCGGRRWRSCVVKCFSPVSQSPSCTESSARGALWSPEWQTHQQPARKSQRQTKRLLHRRQNSKKHWSIFLPQDLQATLQYSWQQRGLKAPVYWKFQWGEPQCPHGYGAVSKVNLRNPKDLNWKTLRENSTVVRQKVYKCRNEDKKYFWENPEEKQQAEQLSHRLQPANPQGSPVSSNTIFRWASGTVSHQAPPRVPSKLSTFIITYMRERIWMDKGPSHGATCPRTGTVTSCSLSLGPVTQQAPGNRKAAVGFHMALDSGKGASPVEAKPLSWSHQPHNSRAPGDGSRVTGVWELICLPHMTAQIILLPLWKAQGSPFMEFLVQPLFIWINERYPKHQGWCLPINIYL